VELAEALESRAFGATEKRTAIVSLKMKPADYLVILVTAAGLVLAAYVYLYVQLPTLVVPFEMPRFF
jgi:energy-coupling factor transporter transmembrane protein EcfT